jgi:hypothetical protein
VNRSYEKVVRRIVHFFREAAQDQLKKKFRVSDGWSTGMDGHSNGNRIRSRSTQLRRPNIERLKLQHRWEINIPNSAVPFFGGKRELGRNRAINAIHEALNAEPHRIGYLDPTSEWSIRHISRQITGIHSIPISKMKLSQENKPRPMFDNDLRKLLDQEILNLVTYRMLQEIESEQMFEVEKINETIKDLNHKAVRIQEIEKGSRSTRE